jgi:calcineurin-like phosphoesterase family protein
MTEVIIENWNARIGPGDIVYHLGDFALSYGKKDADAIDDILAHLNGNKFLITGNHDRDEVTKNKRWIKVLPYHEIKVDLGAETPQRINMFHYSMRTWNQQGRGSWALYGHSHGNLPQPPGKCMDVGVDPNYFTPLNIMTIKRIMDKKPIFTEDHHGEGKKV